MFIKKKIKKWNLIQKQFLQVYFKITENININEHNFVYNCNIYSICYMYDVGKYAERDYKV